MNDNKPKAGKSGTKTFIYKGRVSQDLEISFSFWGRIKILFGSTLVQTVTIYTKEISNKVGYDAKSRVLPIGMSTKKYYEWVKRQFEKRQEKEKLTSV